MAKKKNKETEEEQQRQSRKEVLIARKHAEEQRKVRMIVGAVVGLLVVLFLIAIINEYLIAPSRPVAEVNENAISLADWQERVRFERAQYINLLEQQLDAFQGDVGTVQQFGGQYINALYEGETLGQTVLNTMQEDIIIAQEAAARGITVTDAEIDEEIGRAYNYFGGDLPTPFPTPTETVEPTPSVTPIPTQVITEVVPTDVPFPTPTLGPTNPPPPTATAVSAEAFQEEWDKTLADYQALGVSEEQYREFIRRNLLRQKVADAIAEEQELATEAEHAAFFIMSFDSEEEANEAAAAIDATNYLTVWNEIKSTPFDPEATSSAFASEILWQTQDSLEGSIGAEASDAVFTLSMGEPSAIIVREIDEETSQYILIMVSGREERPLSESVIQQAKAAALTSYIDRQLTGALTLTGYDEGRTPMQPRLDEKFLAAPTATPPLPEIDVEGEPDN